MSFFDFLKPYQAPLTGYIGDSEEWVKNLPHHELFAGGNTNPIDWASLAPIYRPQESTMMCTAFAGSNVVSMLNNKEKNESKLFSPVELFVRSGGSVSGNSIQNTAKAMQDYLIPEESCPWIGPVSEWNPFILKLMSSYVDAKIGHSVIDQDAGAAYAIKNISLVVPDRPSMKAALLDSPLIAIVNVGRGYFDAQAPFTSYGSAHAVAVVRIMDDGSILVFDSLDQGRGFDGFHWLSPAFQIIYAFGIVDLPNDWKHIQESTKDEVYGFNRSHYGKKQDIFAESRSNMDLQIARKNNPTHAAYLDKLWDVYVNAMTYGGYSTQDILNDISNLRHGKPHIFNFNLKKS